MVEVGTELPLLATHDAGPRWAKIIDQSRCIGCHACTTACKSENEVPLSVSRTYVKSVDVGEFPNVSRNFQVTRCNQCADAPCVTACPTSAMFTRDDGIVDFDKDSCIGCKACIAACPYDAIFINPEDHSAEKCNFCAHRIDVGLEPACSVVCPVEAILVGDLNDPDSKVARTVGRDAVGVRRPEKDTQPKLFYKDADTTTLDPLAARRPTGDIFAWAQQPPENDHQINSGVPAGTVGSSSAAAILSYDVSHSVPWDWRVGLYTWTKSIAAGLFGVLGVLVMLGSLPPTSTLWALATPIVAGGMLAATAAVLVWDLEHPSRFWYILTRPQWRSWLVRGGIILSVFALVLALHFVAGLAGADGMLSVLAVVGLPVAVLAAVYTAFLFAQAKGRDLWQNPLLVPHMAVQALVAGGAAGVLLAAAIEPGLVGVLAWIVAASAAIHLLLVLGELTLPHPTVHARMAAHNLVTGRLGRFFWASVALTALGLLTPAAPVVGALVVLVGLLAFEHAYVQAGQSVPLA